MYSPHQKGKTAVECEIIIGGSPVILAVQIELIEPQAPQLDAIDVHPCVFPYYKGDRHRICLVRTGMGATRGVAKDRMKPVDLPATAVRTGPRNSGLRKLGTKQRPT